MTCTKARGGPGKISGPRGCHLDQASTVPRLTAGSWLAAEKRALKGVGAPQGWGTNDSEEKKLVKEERQHRGSFGLLWSQGSQRMGKIKSHQSNSQLVHLPPFEVKGVEVSAGVGFFQVKDSAMFLKLLSHLHPSVFSFFLGF